MGLAPTKTELTDLFWRSMWTFIAAFTGSEVMIAIMNYDVTALQTVIMAGGGAVITVIKAYASNKLGTGTATSKTEPSVGLAPVASLSATPAQ